MQSDEIDVSDVEPDKDHDEMKERKLTTCWLPVNESVDFKPFQTSKWIILRGKFCRLNRESECSGADVMFWLFRAKDDQTMKLPRKNILLVE